MKYFRTTFSFTSTDDSPVDDEKFKIARELCPAIAGELGYESFEDINKGIAGYIQQQTYDETLLRSAFECFPMPGILVEWRTEAVEDRNWNEEWEKSGYTPIIIGNKCVIHDTTHTIDGHYDVDIVIDAHQAFGTGTHDTTQMIIEEIMETNMTGKDALDCGCGTGILSIVATKLGAKTATGYDIDEWSVRNTCHNAKLNNLENIRVFHGDSYVLGNEISESFDIAFANINRNILTNDMPTISQHIKNGGILIISGFYTTDINILESKATSLGLTTISIKESNGWCMLKLKKD